jgi:hypothetical protein
MLELQSIEQYEAEYSALVRLLGVAEATPAPGELAFLRNVATPRRYPFGMLSPADTLFAAAVTSILRPHVLLEIGTASGFSAAVLAKMIALRTTEAGRDLTGTIVHTLDTRAHVPGNASKPMGYAIDVLVPELRPHIAVHAGVNSSISSQLLRPGELPLAFIDGNHQHPWPLHDVLQVAALIPAHGWILMHDIALPEVIRAAQAARRDIQYEPRFGAQHVFEAWPDEAVCAGNIGAVRVPSERKRLAELAERLREKAIETTENSARKLWRAIDVLTEKFR